MLRDIFASMACVALVMASFSPALAAQRERDGYREFHRTDSHANQDRGNHREKRRHEQYLQHAKEVRKDHIILGDTGIDLTEDRGRINLAVSVPVADHESSFTVSTKKCGRFSRLLDTFAKQSLSVVISGRQFQFIPLMLTNKTNYKVYAVKARNACIGEVSQTHDGFVVELKASNNAKEKGVLLEVDMSGRIRYDEMGSQFFLMPYFQGTEVSRPFPSIVADGLAKYKCSNRRNCSYQRNYFVERKFIERLRALRSPTLPGDQRSADLQDFLAPFGRIEGARRVFHELVILDKLGQVSPYELQDTLAADVGPSFCANQMDLAKNDRSGAKVFDTIVGQFWNRKDSGHLIKNIESRTYERPIRKYRVEDLDNLYNDWPLINTTLRSEPGRKQCNRLYLSYLERQASIFYSLVNKYDFIRKYPWLGFYFVGASDKIEHSRAFLAKISKAARTSASPENVELRLRDLMREETYGKQHPDDVDRRMDTVIRIVRQHYG